MGEEAGESYPKNLTDRRLVPYDAGDWRKHNVKYEELTWLAGLLEGEGSFMRGPPSEPNRVRISVDMTDEDVIRKVAVLMEASYVECGKDRRNTKWKPYFRVMVRGNKAARLMRLVFPLLYSRRQAQIDRALLGFIARESGDNARKLSEDDVRMIRRRPDEKAAVLSREFGISRAQVRRIRDNKSWKGI